MSRPLSIYPTTKSTGLIYCTSIRRDMMPDESKSQFGPPKRTPSLHAQRSQVHPLIWNVHAELIFRTQTRYDGLDSIRNREIDAVLLNEECLGPYSSVIHARLFVASNVGGERVGSKRDCDNEKKLNRCVKIKKNEMGDGGAHSRFRICPRGGSRTRSAGRI
jgi:hypothetical protein